MYGIGATPAVQTDFKWNGVELDGSDYIQFETEDVTAWTGMTLVFRAQKLGTHDQFTRFFAITNASQDEFRIIKSGSDFLGQFDDGSIGTSITYTGMDAETRAYTIFLAHANGTTSGYILFDDGEEFFASASDSVNFSSASGLVRLNSDTIRFGHNRYEFCGYWDRGLTREEMRAFARAPYGIFRPKVPMPVFVPAAAGTTNVNLDAASFSLTGYDTTESINTNLALDAASFALTGFDTTETIGRGVALDAASFSLTGFDTTETINRSVALDAASFSLTGYDAAISLSGDTAVPLDAGSFSLTGYDTTESIALNVALDAGSFSLTGFDTTETINKPVLLDAGSFSLTGYDVSISAPANTDVSLDAASFSLTGYNAEITVPSAAPTRQPGGWLPDIVYIDEKGREVDLKKVREEVVEAVDEELPAGSPQRKRSTSPVKVAGRVFDALGAGNRPKEADLKRVRALLKERDEAREALNRAVQAQERRQRQKRNNASVALLMAS